MSLAIERPEAEPFEPFERGSAFDKLHDLMGSARPPLALIGSGASLNSGYPTWPELMMELREIAGPAAKIPQRRSILEADAPWEAEVHRKSIGPDAFDEFITRRFGQPKRLAEPHIQIARMPFRHFLTTNYDPCIELALAEVGRGSATVSWENSDALSDFLIGLSSAPVRPSVVYMHGRFDNPVGAVLTESSYVDRYIKSDDARRKLLAIFMTQPVVFIGFSMNDPDLANLMREVTARLRTIPPSHYAVMGYGSEPEREAVRERMQGKFGVEPVFYSHSKTGPDRHANLNLLLTALCAAPGAKRDTPAKLVGTTSTLQDPITPVALRPVDPNDPEKGQWGGQSEGHGRHLTYVAHGGSREDGYLTLELVIEGLAGSPPLEGAVRFHLHPTFNRSTRVVLAKRNRASVTCNAYGAFTFGVSADEDATRLELDLALQPKLPQWFRRR